MQIGPTCEASSLTGRGFPVVVIAGFTVMDGDLGRSCGHGGAHNGRRCGTGAFDARRAGQSTTSSSIYASPVCTTPSMLSSKSWSGSLRERHCRVQIPIGELGGDGCLAYDAGGPRPSRSEPLPGLFRNGALRPQGFGASSVVACLVESISSALASLFWRELRRPTNCAR